jgi:hypothetical protein
MANKRKQEIALIYAKLASKLKTYPAKSDLAKAGVSRDITRYYFGNITGLKGYAREKLPQYFEKIIDPEFFNDETHRELVKETKKYRRFIVTTAVAGAPVHQDFLESIKKYAEINKAMVLVFPANYALNELDRDLVSDPAINVIFKPIRLNSNLFLDPIKIDPKQVDPVVGLDAIGKTEGTVIVGSPKQRRVPIANSNEKMARIIQGTGAITKPKYIPKDGIEKRRDRLAMAHHKMGAVIIELVDDNLYHFRIVEMSKNGSFNDLFHNYSEDGKVFAGCEAIVQGDYHTTETDPLVDAAVDEMCRIGKPKYRVFHDFFSGVSINHHEMKNKVLRAVLAGQNKLSLIEELKSNAKALYSKIGLAQKLVMVKSNHDEFLDRYLATGEFDDGNRITSTKLQISAMESKDPLKEGLAMVMKEEEFKKLMANMVWLKRDQDFKVAGVELGAHGDLGSNGRKNPGSKGMYKAYGKVFYGHCHYGEIWHEAMSVGTSSYKKLGYNKGSSSWDNSQGIVYKDGTRQLINVINGKWKL